ncbi:hypothetical protein AWZ03_012628 [Drosophila navojoa]|uniref:Uncharacterized protein n=1 Tax=Drosophila navojoa TaxID=7232 RepID=A0A484AZD4_DRONA|nr:hypothetical protein AWZ03_012628 [Drosophila navojoa]
MLGFSHSGGLLTLCLALFSGLQSVCHAQLSFHTDANTNSFTLKTPSLQQSFTRYYGSAKQQEQPQAALQQQQQQQQQQQLVSLV